MLGTDIALKHQVAVERHQDFLAEAKRQQIIVDAYGQNLRTRRNSISEARAAIATLLLRAGSWLMPDDVCQSATSRGLELRPGR